VVRVIAVVATYNERRFIGGFIEHCVRQGVGVYVIDNESTDDTVEIARRYDGRGLVGLESLPRAGVFDLGAQLRRKAEVCAELEADWFIHADADERRLPRRSDTTLAAALAECDAGGYNAVNFIEYVFVPTLEAPDHDHDDFERTMRSYYPHVPVLPHRLNAWRRQDQLVDLAASGGHRVWFEELRPAPWSLPMRHYLFLSREHAVEKYIGRGYDAEELRRGWHQARSELRPEEVALQPEEELRWYDGDDALDSSDPWTSHPVFDPVIARLFPDLQSR
jgi:glycosyltransferase involved in cell wall biosynthesis